jgi:hypothetical protein
MARKCTDAHQRICRFYIDPHMRQFTFAVGSIEHKALSGVRYCGLDTFVSSLIHG